MWYVIIGLIIGLGVGSITPLNIPVDWARYTAVGIVAILDSVFGAIRSDLQEKYNATIFVSGLVTNILVAAGITILGDKLGIDIYLAVVVAFTIRILSNLGTIRYSFLTRFIGHREVKKQIYSNEEQF